MWEAAAVVGGLRTRNDALAEFLHVLRLSGMNRASLDAAVLLSSCVGDSSTSRHFRKR